MVVFKFQIEAQEPGFPVLLPSGHLLSYRPWPRPWLHPGLTTLSPHPQKQKRDEAAINKIMKDLDTDGDKDLTFEEFAILIGKLTEASHEEMHRTAPPGEGHSHGPGFGESRGTCHSQGGTGQTEGGHGHGHSHGGHGHSHDGHGHSHNH